MNKLILAGIAAIFAVQVKAQETTPKFQVSGYLETYYIHDFNNPTDNNRPGFVYSHNRSREVNLNLGFIKGVYQGDNLRANIALMAGTYTNVNLAAEPGVLKNVFEANVGVKLSSKANLWLDAGIMPSHIGFESAISKDCWALTRSMVADNTPYYETGAKLSYATEDQKFSAALLYLNGWQRIARVDGNSKPAGGLQLTYKPSSKITLNYSNYLGTEGLDAVTVTRFYHNFYAVAQVTDAFGLTLGLDYGTQQKVKGNSDKSEILAPIVIAQYAFAPKWAIAGRYEYYKDIDGIFIATPNGFKTSGYSLNLDYKPMSFASLRLEGKLYDSAEKVFERGEGLVSHNGSITASMAISF